MRVIDGNMSEGGGQILRIATSLSVILQLPVNIQQIRGGRKKPGLKAQHLNGVQLLTKMTGAHVEGDQLNSLEIFFTPNKLKSGPFNVDVGTAGAVTLLLQSSLPPALFAGAPSTFNFIGGTNVEWSPPVDFNIQVLFPTLKQMGVQVDCDLVKRGYFPKGGGKCSFHVEPLKRIEPISLMEFGEVRQITGRAFVAGTLPIKIAREMSKKAESLLKAHNSHWKVSVEFVKEDEHESYGNGTGIFLLAETTTGCLLSGSALGRRGLPAADVARTAVEELLKSLTVNACVDEHLQDQLLIMMSLAAGKSSLKTVELSDHSSTAIKLIGQFLPEVDFSVTPLDGGGCTIECEGIGHVNKLW